MSTELNNGLVQQALRMSLIAKRAYGKQDSPTEKPSAIKLEAFKLAFPDINVEGFKIGEGFPNSETQRRWEGFIEGINLMRSYKASGESVPTPDGFDRDKQFFDLAVLQAVPALIEIFPIDRDAIDNGILHTTEPLQKWADKIANAAISVAISVSDYTRSPD